MSRAIALVIAAVVALCAPSAVAQSATMKMAMTEGPAHFRPTRQAYTTNHRFLVRLLALPTPIPFEKYFDLHVAVYDGHHPKTRLNDARLSLFAGMRHGMKHGFAHGMQSSPEVAKKGGVFTVSGMYFHMNGPWVVKMTVHAEGHEGVAYFRLPCCGK